jgi:hypothetical protein
MLFDGVKMASKEGRGLYPFTVVVSFSLNGI